MQTVTDMISIHRYLIGLAFMILSTVASSQQAEDPYLWLEDVGGDKALSWVKAQNAQTIATLRLRQASRG